MSFVTYTGWSAPINIDGTTIYSGLNIPWHRKIFLVSDKNWPLLGNKHSEIQLIVINKISMVLSKLLFQMDQRIIQLFESLSNYPFSGKSVILCSDLFHLLSVTTKPEHVANLEKPDKI